MAAKGQAEKQSVIATILETFPNSFLYNDNKEVRIPVGDVQIKVALTCAKDNVLPGADTLLPGADILLPGEPSWVPGGGFDEMAEAKPSIVEPTQEELDRVNAFVMALNL